MGEEAASIYVISVSYTHLDVYKRQALPGVIAANTTLPVIGVPVKGSVLDGVDALYSIIQMCIRDSLYTRY